MKRKLLLFGLVLLVMLFLHGYARGLGQAASAPVAPADAQAATNEAAATKKPQLGLEATLLVIMGASTIAGVLAGAALKRRSKGGLDEPVKFLSIQ